MPLEEAHLVRLLAGRRPAHAAPSAPGAGSDIIAWLQAQDPALLKAVPAFNAAVGNWASADIAIKDEHLFVLSTQRIEEQ